MCPSHVWTSTPKGFFSIRSGRTLGHWKKKGKVIPAKKKKRHTIQQSLFLSLKTLVTSKEEPHLIQLLRSRCGRLDFESLHHHHHHHHIYFICIYA